MIIKNFDELVEINRNPNWPYIPDHPYRILIIAGLESAKTNVLLKLIKHHRPDINKIYLYVKVLHLYIQLNQSIDDLPMEEKK